MISLAKLGGRPLCGHARTITTHGANSVARRHRSTLSTLWLPTGGLSAADGEGGYGKLVRAGFVRQSQSGIFHLLPLGLKVQNKIEALLDMHMDSIGASKLAMSTITSEDLWRKSDRLEKVASELFRLQDRKETSLMLAPTHEEEITTLVANAVQSYKDLPLRLYQTTRKYRDEMRPRQGLLRGREFLMKDLYTFDLNPEAAIETYAHVSGAYKAFFADMKLPVHVAEASSGDMGGNYSHEYHLANHIGEDTVASCSSCGYTANDEVAISRKPGNATQEEAAVAAGDGCPKCENGKLEVSKAIELGHTFYLGTRYSDPLQATYLPKGSTQRIPIQMGCYGIGVSRIFGAVAEHKADTKGLTWPRAIAPFEAVVIPTSGVDETTLSFYDGLEGAGANGSQFDIALDDRNKPFGWKMQDADVIGYPVTIVLGKAWRESKTCEIQCRSLSLKQNVAANDVPKFLQQVLHRL